MPQGWTHNHVMPPKTKNNTLPTELFSHISAKVFDSFGIQKFRPRHTPEPMWMLRGELLWSVIAIITSIFQLTPNPFPYTSKMASFSHYFSNSEQYFPYRLSRCDSNHHWDTPFPMAGSQIAAANGHTNVIHTLLLYVAHADHMDKHGVTSEMLVRDNGKGSMVDMLRVIGG